MLCAKVPVREIATAIGRHHSTTYREIKRNGLNDDEWPDLDGYCGVTAQRAADAGSALRM